MSSFARRGAPRPTTLEGQVRWLENRLQLLEDAYGELRDSVATISHVAPDRPRNGMLRIADGTNWDPGSGFGLYQYDSSVPGWTKL